MQVHGVANRFRNLFALNRDVRMMHPVVYIFAARNSFGLSDFVVVMHWDVLDAAGVDVDLFAEQLKDHRGALDVPAREANAPRRVPLLLPLLRRVRNLPQCKVGRIALFGNRIHASTLFLASQIDIAKRAVGGEFFGIKINTVFYNVGIAFFFERLDERDLLGDILGSSWELYFRAVYTDCVQIFKINFSDSFGYLMR